MCRQVTWGEFLLFLSILVVIYYSIIGVKYFLLDRRGGRGEQKAAPENADGKAVRQEKGVLVKNEFTVLQRLIRQLKLVIHNQVKAGATRDILLAEVWTVLSDAKHCTDRSGLQLDANGNMGVGHEW